MSKSIEERLWDSHKADTELRRLFDAYVDPRHEFWGLVDVLSSIQKVYGPCDWIAKVNDVMQAMEVHDAGLFPDDGFDELDGGRNDREKPSPEEAPRPSAFRLGRPGTVLHRAHDGWLTQDQACIYLGVTRRTIYNSENGKTRIPFPAFKLLRMRAGAIVHVP